MKFLCSFEDRLAKAEKIALTALLLALVACSFLQVALRIAAKTGILWMDPLLRHAVMWLGFLGAAIASYHNKHFALDAVLHFLPEKMRRPVQAANHIFTTAVCCVLLYASFQFLQTEKGIKLFSIGSLPVKAIWLESILPLGFALIVFHTFMGLFRRRQDL
jgi:TRAP-type C4-dicarboxylate transport system permease small subunit